MKVASIAEAKAKLSDYVERCRCETVTKHGHPRAALVALENDDDLESVHGRSALHFASGTERKAHG